MMLRRVGMMLVIGAVVVFGVIPASASTHQIRICHKLGNGGYSQPIPTKHQIFDPDGHGSFVAGVHPGDIVPPFAAGSQGNNEWDDYPGKNWTIEGQTIWNNACQTVTTTTTSTPTTTTSVPSTTSTSTTTPTTTTVPLVSSTTTSVTTISSSTTTTAPTVSTTTVPDPSTTTTVGLVTSTVPPTSTTITVTPPSTPTELPRTGPTDFWPMAGLAAGLLVAGMAALTISRMNEES